MREKLKRVATTSYDPHTKIACIVVSHTGETLLKSSNRFPDGIMVTEDRLKRPAKYLFIMHAEARAIAMAAQKGIGLVGRTMYLNWFPCSTCAAMIAQSGIKELVADRDNYEARKDDPRYNFAEAMAILTESGVEINWLQDPACPACGKHGVSFESRSCQSTETHGLDCGPFETFFDEWYVCSDCGAALSKEEVQDAQKEAACKST